MNAQAVDAVLPLLGLALVAVAIVGTLIAQPWWQARRRAQVRARPFPAAWRRILRRRMPIFARLPPDVQMRLRRHIQVFLAEKPFIGCNGQAIDDEVRVTIAGHACLLLLGQARPDCYPRLRQVLVYPDAFVVNRERPLGAGLVQEQRRAMVGESWDAGQVILSWAEVAAGLQRLRNEPSTVIDAYGASEPAEFFAVVTEAFFERPAALAAEAPAVYDELVALYGVDPMRW